MITLSIKAPPGYTSPEPGEALQMPILSQSLELNRSAWRWGRLSSLTQISSALELLTVVPEARWAVGKSGEIQLHAPWGLGDVSKLQHVGSAWAQGPAEIE